ncbi:NUDIX domain-containing protein [Nonomuraea sp. 3-1Str]|uniref:NUDIX domain-containing protein n=1 Tax=Nonomuraea sp. 3-1Str TaxID=2929801 RepID=UPI002857A0FB|nr:NUDIX domain-containing protein [Nonomuraea sp. 3-1Str]MDR8415079.1 NUDIX domain-containing protein [Nonomuraea sp. 3-1Str]
MNIPDIVGDESTFTHPDVLDRGVAEGWADPRTDPTTMDWPARQAAALIPFEVVDGRPLNPFRHKYPTGIRYGRAELGHWGEQVCADAVVTSIDGQGRRWLVMVERGDGHGWALPGGTVDPGEDPADAAIRELAEETGLDLADKEREVLPARYVPDPRASDEAWMVTVPVRIDLGEVADWDVPVPVGADDAACAAWVPADSYAVLVDHLQVGCQARVFAAHQELLRDLLDS